MNGTKITNDQWPMTNDQCHKHNYICIIFSIFQNVSLPGHIQVPLGGSCSGKFAIVIVFSQSIRRWNNGVSQYPSYQKTFWLIENFNWEYPSILSLISLLFFWIFFYIWRSQFLIIWLEIFYHCLKAKTNATFSRLDTFSRVFIDTEIVWTEVSWTHWPCIFHQLCWAVPNSDYFAWLSSAKHF